MPSTDALNALNTPSDSATQLAAEPAFPTEPALPPEPALATEHESHASATLDGQLPAPPVAPLAAPLPSSIPPEVMDQSIEVMILTSSRPVPFLKLAVALGLIDPEAPQAPEASSSPAPSPADQPPLEASDAAAPTDGEAPAASAPAVPTPQVRTRRKFKTPKKADPEVLIAQSIARLNETYSATNRQFRIELVAGGYRLLTLPQHHGLLARFHGLAAQTRLSKPAVETLAIIAYKQPVTRAQLEAIRGVACGEVLRSLLDRRLINIVGRAEELGRPMLYGTTRGFLELFGLASLKDLPAPSDLSLTPSKT